MQKMEEKIDVRSGERLHLQWHKDTFSQAHDSANSKLKVKHLIFPWSVKFHADLSRKITTDQREHGKNGELAKIPLYITSL